MINGEYTFYAVQWRTKAKGEWSKLDSALKAVAADEKNCWSVCGSDYWGRSTNPHIGLGNDWRPKNRQASNEFRDCKRKTGTHGWFTLEYAMAALRRLKADDEKGMYNSIETYGTVMQIVRHEFRIVTIQLVHRETITPTTIDEVVVAA